MLFTSTGPRTIFTLLVLAPLAGALVLPAQMASRSPAYDITLVKPNISGSNAGALDAPWGTFTNVTLQTLISYAYSVPNEQVTGGPAWVKSDHFDLKGKMSDTDEAAFGKLAKREQEQQRKLMLQALLTDRFGLKVSNHASQTNSYALVVARKGSKLRASGQHGPPQPSRCTPACTMALSDPKATIGNLANILTSVLGRPVLDATGLTGTFDLEYAVPLPENQATDDLTTRIQDALQDQLGLDLEQRRVPANAVRIEAVERPSEN